MQTLIVCPSLYALRRFGASAGLLLVCVRVSHHQIDTPAIVPPENLEAEPHGRSLPYAETGVTALEIKPQGKLNQTRIVQLLIDDSESARRIDVLKTQKADSPHKELRVIEQVKELGAELQIHVLA